MRKIKTKIDNRKITIAIYIDGEKADEIVRYHNSCMICKEKTINTEDFGEEYICESCAEWLKEKLVIKNVDKDLETEENNVKVIQRRYRLHPQIKTYVPEFKIWGMDIYKARITAHSIYKETLYALTDLVLKGENTSNKIHNTLTKFKQETIYKYLMAMVNAKILITEPLKKCQMARYERVFAPHPSLIYFKNNKGE